MLVKKRISTSKRSEFIDITNVVRATVSECGKEDGAVIVFCPHTTGGITINENADPSVVSDLTKKLALLIPKNENYEHLEGNSDSHLKSSLFGASESVIFEKGELLLGVWQSIYFCEFDGPRNRSFYIKVL